MSPPAKPDLWSDLSDLTLSEGMGSDARASLLRINAEMFVAAPARDREIIETFEALALGFLPQADSDTVVEVARILAPCSDTPASVLHALAHHSHEAREILVRGNSQPTYPLNRTLLATKEGRLQLSSRADLDPTNIDRLLALREEEVEIALATNLSSASAQTALPELLRRARTRPSLAQALLARTDLAAADEAALYLAADGKRRSLIRHTIQAAATNQRAILSLRLRDHHREEIFAASLQGDVGQVEKLLSSAFGFPETVDWRVLELGRHRLLALALKALGFEKRDAARVLLTLHPALSYPVSSIKDLLREMRDVPGPVALALVEAILNVQAFSDQTR